MFDIKLIRENPADFDTGLARRGLEPRSVPLLALDESRRAVLTDLQAKQEARNEASKKIGQAKGSGDDALARTMIETVSRLKQEIQDGEDEARRIEAELENALLEIPNLPHTATPDGQDESQNVERRRIGEPQERNFPQKEHFDIGEGLGLLDFDAAARMSGARFAVLRGALARLERALAQFMLDMHTTEFGYTEVSPPLLVREPAMYGTGQLPKFREDQFSAGEEHWLVPTAEVPLTNLVREQILEASALPIRVTAFTPCFRREAGSAGRDTRGLIRLHQFPKVELVSIVHPDDADEELERMTGCAEEVLRRLGLAYRVVDLCTGDIGFSARRTYDLEVWLAGQGAYREISSCSVCGDFQARRMNARFRPDGEKGTRFVHTLNGSGVAVGRALVAILEQYQEADGTVAIPDALRPYMGGLEAIEPPAGGL